MTRPAKLPRHAPVDSVKRCSHELRDASRQCLRWQGHAGKHEYYWSQAELDKQRDTKQLEKMRELAQTLVDALALASCTCAIGGHDTDCIARVKALALAAEQGIAPGGK